VEAVTGSSSVDGETTPSPSTEDRQLASNPPIAAPGAGASSATIGSGVSKEGGESEAAEVPPMVRQHSTDTMPPRKAEPLDYIRRVRAASLWPLPRLIANENWALS